MRYSFNFFIISDAVCLTMPKTSTKSVQRTILQAMSSALTGIGS